MTIALEKVYAAKVRENYAAILNEIAPPKLEDVVLGLEKHLAGLGVEMLPCDVCGGKSPEKLPDGTVVPACPFCNDGDVGGAKPPPPTPKPATAIVAAPKKPAASAPSLMLAGGREKYTEKDLDASIVRLRSASDQSADSAYLMGKELVLIREHLWELRRGEDGKPKYKSYNEFLEKELDISVGFGNKVRRIAEVFTLDQFRAFGVEALKALIAAPKEVHEMLLEKRAQGASIQELEEDVRQIREQKGIEVLPPAVERGDAGKKKAAQTSKATAAAAAKAKANRAAITIGLKHEVTKFDFLARPKKKSEEPRAARTMEDQPYAKIPALNGVTLVLSVKPKPNGEWEGKLVACRDESENPPDDAE